MYVLLLAPYKTGTSFLEKYLRESGIPCVRLHGYDANERARYPMDRFTHLITLRRTDRRLLWLSAMLQDLSQTTYAYAYGDKEAVARASLDDFLRHYRSQRWETYRWLNYEYYDARLAEFAACGIPCLTLLTESLSTSRALLCDFLGSEDLLTSLRPSHVTRDGFHGDLYLELRKALSI